MDAQEKMEQDAYEAKSAYMKRALGNEHGIVMHAAIPWFLGGGLDLYYYPNYTAGTAIVTKELSDAAFKGPKNGVYDAYELVMVTRHTLDTDSDAQKHPKKGTFAWDNRLISSILNCIGLYAANADVNPCDTLEFPHDFENNSALRGKCFIFDALCEPLCSTATRNRKFGLMLAMEIRRDEMEYAMSRKGNGRALLTKLKEHGVYPYTGADRPSVLE